MADTVEKLDVEWRVEAAVLEIIRAVAGWVALMQGADADARKANMKRPEQYGSEVKTPCQLVDAQDFVEHTSRTGWYRGNVVLTACTHKADDEDKSIVSAIFGYMRGFGQLTDLPTQINDTAAAQAAATALACEHAECDGVPFDEGREPHMHEKSLPVSLLVRPSR